MNIDLKNGDINLIVAGLDSLWREATEMAARYGLEDTKNFFCDPAEVKALSNRLRCPVLSDNPAHVCADRDGNPVAGTERDCFLAARREAVRGG